MAARARTRIFHLSFSMAYGIITAWFRARSFTFYLFIFLRFAHHWRAPAPRDIMDGHQHGSFLFAFSLIYLLLFLPRARLFLCIYHASFSFYRYIVLHTIFCVLRAALFCLFCYSAHTASLHVTQHARAAAAAALFLTSLPLFSAHRASCVYNASALTALLHTPRWVDAVYGVVCRTLFALCAHTSLHTPSFFSPLWLQTYSLHTTAFPLHALHHSAHALATCCMLLGHRARLHTTRVSLLYILFTTIWRGSFYSTGLDLHLAAACFPLPAPALTIALLHLRWLPLPHAHTHTHIFFFSFFLSLYAHCAAHLRSLRAGLFRASLSASFSCAAHACCVHHIYARLPP